MLAQHRTSVSLSLASFDLPVWSIVETEATLYQKDQERFHLLLTEPLVQDAVVLPGLAGVTSVASSLDAASPVEFTPATPRLLWLELSPYRVTMTMQGNGSFSYRHFWEQGVYGVSRYWLQTIAPLSDTLSHNQVRLRNFTRSLFLKRDALPQHLRVEYELWANQLHLGHYVMNVELHS
ncbi:MAG: hypothetical protein IGS50_19820 [Synechococcales cyanobacterium C42_A2020_086]|jgi:hypothetical protein|nr:hypothetical protein [Synechococcales cyanobacterium M58_A2018_015]MBF2075987.1 hypothetical protein [Synechococcales cyanobacterium C42_A2020_086]